MTRDAQSGIPATSAELSRWRSIPADQTLNRLANHVKHDPSFRPSRAHGTLRVHVSAGQGEWEFLIDGTRFYDTRAKSGGGGAIDLVMHIWQVTFREAVEILREAEL